MSHELKFNSLSSKFKVQKNSLIVDRCPLTFIIFAIMRIILLYILLALLGQQTTFLETENLKTSESEKSCEQRAMSNETFLESENLKISESEKRLKSQGRNAQGSQHEAQSPSRVFSFSVSQILYFENQIRLADSLYKNYLPQYNFEEVKAAVMFFDSLRLTTDNSQRTTDLLESENLKTSESEKRLKSQGRNAQSSQHEAQSLKKTVDCCPLTVDIEYQRARAHYYHAVGLTERDDIVGACEHYLCALEIMETKTENLKTSKSEKSQGRKAQSSKLEVQSPDYEKIRFVALINTNLSRLYSDTFCDDIALKLIKSAYVIFKDINDTMSYLYASNEIGNIYLSLDSIDEAKHWFNINIKESCENDKYVSFSKNSMAGIYFKEGKTDTAISIIRDLILSSPDKNDKKTFEYSLSEIYHNTNHNDSALFLAKSAFNSDNTFTKTAAANILYKIYDNMGIPDSSTRYKNFYINECDNIIDNTYVKSKIISLYNDYKNKKETDGERNHNIWMPLFLFLFLSSLILIIIIKISNYRSYKNKRNLQYEALLNSDVVLKLKKTLCCLDIKTTLPKNYYSNYKISSDEINVISKEVERFFPSFYTNLKSHHHGLSCSNVRYCTLIFLDFNYKEIAIMMGVGFNSAWEHISMLKSKYNIDKNRLINYITQ